MKVAKSARRLGRPAANINKQGDKREKTPDAAEEVFAESVNAATSLRNIARRAAANPALIAYYVESKERLFEELFKRRGTLIAKRWDELLDELETRPGKPPTLLLSLK